MKATAVLGELNLHRHLKKIRKTSTPTKTNFVSATAVAAFVKCIEDQQEQISDGGRFRKHNKQSWGDKRRQGRYADRGTKTHDKLAKKQVAYERRRK